MPKLFISSALILSRDRLHAEMIASWLSEDNPRGYFFCAGTVADARAVVCKRDFEMLVSTLEASDADVLDSMLAWRNDNRFRRSFVITTRRGKNVVDVLSRLRVDGVFDPETENPKRFLPAIRRVASGERYWSESMTAVANARRVRLKIDLTPTERIILATIGDGCDDDVGAERLGLKKSTIVSARRELHRKIGIKHRGQLVCAAIVGGFVNIDDRGVHRPGLSVLSAVRRDPGKHPID